MYFFLLCFFGYDEYFIIYDRKKAYLINTAVVGWMGGGGGGDPLIMVFEGLHKLSWFTVIVSFYKVYRLFLNRQIS